MPICVYIFFLNFIVYCRKEKKKQILHCSEVHVWVIAQISNGTIYVHLNNLVGDLCLLQASLSAARQVDGSYWRPRGWGHHPVHPDGPVPRDTVQHRYPRRQRRGGGQVEPALPHRVHREPKYGLKGAGRGGVTKYHGNTCDTWCFKTSNKIILGYYNCHYHNLKVVQVS